MVAEGLPFPPQRSGFYLSGISHVFPCLCGFSGFTVQKYTSSQIGYTKLSLAVNMCTWCSVTVRLSIRSEFSHLGPRMGSRILWLLNMNEYMKCLMCFLMQRINTDSESKRIRRILVIILLFNRLTGHPFHLDWPQIDLIDFELTK